MNIILNYYCEILQDIPAM